MGLLPAATEQGMPPGAEWEGGKMDVFPPSSPMADSFHPATTCGPLWALSGGSNRWTEAARHWREGKGREEGEKCPKSLYELSDKVMTAFK